MRTSLFEGGGGGGGGQESLKCNVVIWLREKVVRCEAAVRRSS